MNNVIGNTVDTLHLNTTNPISSVQLDLVTCVATFTHDKKRKEHLGNVKSTTDSGNIDCSSYDISGNGNEKGISQSVAHL